MTQENKQYTNSDARSEQEFNKLWSSIERLTEIQHQGALETMELRTNVKTLVDKIDGMLTNGTTRCADHNARLEALERADALINTGDHPACQAHTAKIQNWIYANTGAAAIALVGVVISLLKAFM
jgi:hypothetical protein